MMSNMNWFYTFYLFFGGFSLLYVEKRSVLSTQGRHISTVSRVIGCYGETSVAMEEFCRFYVEKREQRHASPAEINHRRVLHKLRQRHTRSFGHSQCYYARASTMDLDIVTSITHLYKQNNWKEIVHRFHDHPERNKLLWVYPSEENFSFVKQCLKELQCDRVLSIGCGSGLLEWMITQATGIPVSGIEVDGAWWHCKYAPPTFIPLHFTPTEIDKDTVSVLQKYNNTALLFCYFNNRKAFEDYLKYYKGNVLIIIGPHEKGVHTDPKPFDDVPKDWILYKSQEIRSSSDFIAVYTKHNV